MAQNSSLSQLWGRILKSGCQQGSTPRSCRGESLLPLPASGGWPWALFALWPHHPSPCFWLLVFFSCVTPPSMSSKHPHCWVWGWLTWVTLQRPFFSVSHAREHQWLGCGQNLCGPLLNSPRGSGQMPKWENVGFSIARWTLQLSS